MSDQTISQNQGESPSEREPDWKELAKISLDEFKSRRELEWKLSLGFWAAIGSFTYIFLTNDKVALPPLWMLTFGYFFAAGIAVVGLIAIQVAHATNKAYFYYFMNKASNECCGKASKPAVRGRRNWTRSNTIWSIVHAIVSCFFLWVSWFLVSSRAPE